MPPFDGIGANEYIVDVVHDVCDFISAVDTPFIWEMNIWYHTLNCGYTCRISGETDFPCIYGERVGLGRAYVKLKGDKNQPLDYDQWALGIRDGRSYCCDGWAHRYDFKVGDLGVGEPAPAAGPACCRSRLARNCRSASARRLCSRETARRYPPPQARCKTVLARRARAVGDTRKVPVELVVNGKVVEMREIEADGSIKDLTFEYTPPTSSWVALRIFAAAHTNPVFVEVDDKPIRASRRMLSGASTRWTCAGSRR